MKNFVARLKTKSFWISLSGAVVMFLQGVGIKVNQPKWGAILAAVCGVLVVLGIVSTDTAGVGDTADEKNGSNNDDKI